MHIHRILCPTDLSDASRRAVDQAVAFAGWHKARMTVLHVLSPMPVLAENLAIVDGRSIDSDIEAVRAEVAAQCDAVVAAGITPDILIEVGHPARQILERASSLPADLIVMGTHGTGGFQHLVLGSVTEKVLQKATCPVVTVPPHAEATAPLPLQRLLCAVDSSDASLEALRYALALTRESNARLTILHVLEWPWHEPPPPSMSELPAAQAEALAEYRRYREESARIWLESLVPAGELRATTRISHGKPYVETLRVAADEKPNLIVIGAHGHNPLALGVFGSTASQLVRRATCPVMTVR